jgi:hypothetical protein
MLQYMQSQQSRQNHHPCTLVTAGAPVYANNTPTGKRRMHKLLCHAAVITPQAQHQSLPLLNGANQLAWAQPGLATLQYMPRVMQQLHSSNRYITHVYNTTTHIDCF